MKLFVLALIVACSLPASARGALLVDQSNVTHYGPAGQGLSNGPNVNNTGAQVVTTGIAGQLSRVDLGLFYSGFSTSEPLFIDIVQVVGDVPNFEPAGRLATRSIASTAGLPTGGTPTYSASLDFSAANLQFSVGDKFAILLRSDAPLPSYGWWLNGVPENSYPGGSSYFRFNPSGVVTNLNNDAHFRTWVQVPEPATSFLVATLLAAATLSSRRCA